MHKAVRTAEGNLSWIPRVISISALHRSYGAQLGQVCALQGLQSYHRRVKAHIPIHHRARSRAALNLFAEHWDEKYPQISKSWRAHRNNLNTLFNFPADIRKVIYTTNAIESLNSMIRKAIKKRKLFPTDDSAQKVIYLAIQNVFKKWTMPIRDCKPALNSLTIEFEERLTDYI